jgi:protein TonB
MNGGGGAARCWIVSLSASLALHAAFFGIFSFSFAAPGAETGVARGTAGMTVTLRRIKTVSAAASTRTAENPKRNAPQAVAVPKKAVAPAVAKKTKQAALPAKPKPAVSDSAGPSPMVSNSAIGQAAAGAETGTGIGKGNGAGKIFELSDLRVLRRVKPDYPVIARKRKEEGTVTLLITLEGGNVSSVKVEKTSGFPALDEAAAAAVRNWRFEAGSGTGAAEPRRIQARVPVTFKLKL